MNYVNQEIFGEFPYDNWGLTLKFRSWCFQSQCCPWENSGLILHEGETIHVAAWARLAHQMSVLRILSLHYYWFPPLPSHCLSACFGLYQLSSIQGHRSSLASRSCAHMLVADVQTTARWSQAQNWTSVSCPQFSAFSLSPTAAFGRALPSVLIHCWLFFSSEGWTKSSLATDTADLGT